MRHNLRWLTLFYLLVPFIPGCTGPLLDYLDNSGLTHRISPPTPLAELNQPEEPLILIPDTTSDLPVQSQRQGRWYCFLGCLKENYGHIYGILLLLFLWLFTRAYHNALDSKNIKISKEDLGLIRMIKVNADILLDKYRPGRKVIHLDDRRK